jgi:hypothetical protein
MQLCKGADLRRACAEFLAEAVRLYRVPTCGVRVLAARPLRVREHWTTELFGDYQPETMLIRLWMRTAVRKEVTSFGTFLSTLCHEFCHHLDFQSFRFADSWHTRGFYERTAALYHHARGTDALQAARLRGRVWHDQGYTIPLMVESTRVLQRAILEFIHEHMLALDLSFLMLDLELLNDSLALQLKTSLTAFLEAEHKAA